MCIFGDYFSIHRIKCNIPLLYLLQLKLESIDLGGDDLEGIKINRIGL